MCHLELAKWYHRKCFDLENWKVIQYQSPGILLGFGSAPGGWLSLYLRGINKIVQSLKSVDLGRKQWPENNSYEVKWQWFMASCLSLHTHTHTHTHTQILRVAVRTISELLSKSLQMVIAAMKLKDTYSLEGKLWPA